MRKTYTTEQLLELIDSIETKVWDNSRASEDDYDYGTYYLATDDILKDLKEIRDGVESGTL